MYGEDQKRLVNSNFKLNELRFVFVMIFDKR